MSRMTDTQPPKNNPFISIVSPVYKAADIVEVLVKKIEQEVTKVTEIYEIILVEDGSPDQSWDSIKKICATNKRVKAIRLSRNFGQNSAIIAGSECSKGDYVVYMDCDLQDDPVYIPNMYQLFDSEIDYVLTRKKYRNQSIFRRLTGKYFYRFFNWIANNNFDENIGGFCMLSRQVVDALLQVSDSHAIFLPTLSWLGYQNTVLEVQNNKRYSGKSSYNIKKLISYSLNMIISNSDKLLNIAIVIGMIFMLGALCGATYIIISIVFFNRPFLVGWPSVFVLILFCTGIILSNLGVMGLYIGKIFEQVKNKPRYLIRETLNY